MERKKCVIYIGDFDLRNENVQAHLVKNNGKILNQLGYQVAFIGVNRNATQRSEIEKLSPLNMGENKYLELPYTLSVRGLFDCKSVIDQIIAYMNGLTKENQVAYVISYQAPTYAVVLDAVAKWCKGNGAKYIVNCADLPIFDAQPFIRRVVMKANWRKMHKTNYKNADGVIAVSKYIEHFYFKKNRPSIIIPPLFDEDVPANNTENAIPTFLYAGTPFAVLDTEVNPKGMKDRLDKVIALFLELSKRKIAYQFLVVGITKEAYTTCVPKHKEALEKETGIEFVGRKTHSQTLAILAQADFMINLRDRNVMTEAGLSTKVVESVSVGTPVVMNAIGDTFDYLTENVSGFVLQGDDNTDADLLERLCALSAAQRVELKKQCSGQRIFAWETYQEKLNRFLKEVNGKGCLPC